MMAIIFHRIKSLRLFIIILVVIGSFIMIYQQQRELTFKQRLYEYVMNYNQRSATVDYSFVQDKVVITDSDSELFAIT